MSNIAQLHGRMALDSRGFPTVEAECILEDGSRGVALVPSGASTGEAEALELRDGGKEWAGKGVEKALGHLRGEICELLSGQDARDQEGIDRRLCEADGTENKARLGANSILAASKRSAGPPPKVVSCPSTVTSVAHHPYACRFPCSMW